MDVQETQEIQSSASTMEVSSDLSAEMATESVAQPVATAYYIFDQCIVRAQNLVSVHDSTKTHGDISDEHYCDCYRAAIVLSISALDAYIRKTIVSKIRDILATSNKPLTKELSDYIKLLLNQDKLLDAARKANLLDIVENAVKDDFATKSFQGEWKITSNLALVGYKDIFSKVAVAANINESNLKAKLQQYTNRRHVIAHSGDYDLNQTPHKENEISKKYAEECIELVSLFAKTMNSIVEGK